MQASGPMARGGSGSGLGYHGITNAISIEFDTWKDGSKNDCNYNHISINRKAGKADSNDYYSIAK